MKKIFYSAALLIAAAVCWSCYEDSGNYDYSDLPEFYVDTVGRSAQMTITMRQFDQLQITPDLVFEGDKSKLEYAWKFYTTAPAGGMTKDNVAIPVGNDPALSMKMTYAPGSYYVEYAASDPTTGRQTLMRWTVTVEGILGAGWMVFHKTGGTSDCDLIKTKLLVGSLATETILRNIYIQSNPGKPITSEPVACGAMMRSTTNWITLLWADGGVRASADDMSIMKTFNELFYTTPPVVKPESIFYRYSGTTTNGVEMIINNGQLGVDDTSNSAGNPLFNGPLVTDDNSATYLAFPCYVYGTNRIVYDQQGMRFLYNNVWSGILGRINSTSQTLFDFDNIGKKMIFMDYGYGPNGNALYAIFRNPTDDGQRYLYIMECGTTQSGSGYRTLGTLNLNAAPGITNADVKFAYGERGPVVLYSSGNKVYRIKYSLDNTSWPFQPDVDTEWTFPADETITAMRFMTHQGVGVAERTDGKYLFVATWNAATSAGKVYVLQVNVSSGVIASEPAAVYTGFGKIKDMCYKAQ